MSDLFDIAGNPIITLGPNKAFDEIKRFLCKHNNRHEEGDCPAGHWWWVCSDCGTKL